MIEEFVVFDKNGKEINWINPYDWHEDVTSESRGLVFGERQYRVSNIAHEYDVVIPKGGRYEIRAICRRLTNDVSRG